MTSFDGPTIGKRIGEYRRLNGWTMEELAQRTFEEVKRDVIANIENGRKKDLTVDQLLSLAMALGVSPAALLFDIYDPFGDSGLRELTGGEQTGEPVHVATAVDWMSGRATSDHAEEIPARNHTQQVLAGCRALLEAMTERGNKRDDIARMQSKADTSGLEARDAAWLEYVKKSLAGVDSRISENYERLTALGVNVEFVRHLGFMESHDG